MQPDPAVGLIVNPFAGIGGEVGLGGSDGVVERAVALGGVPRAPERARRFIAALRRRLPGAQIVTAPGRLGGDYAPGARVVGAAFPAETDGGHTTELARRLVLEGVTLLAFVGGDGTARDVMRGIPDDQLCLGIPAGVKMHSAVFALTPEDAAEQVAEALAGRGRRRARDVVDLDEDARRAGTLSTSIFGAMVVPEHERVQRGKRSPLRGSAIDAVGIADELRRRSVGEALVLGPGTTMARIARELGVADPTLLGCDLIDASGQCHLDLSGADLERLIDHRPFSVALSPVGGQGVIIGRGNHQLTARLLHGLVPDRLIVVADPEKLGQLAGSMRIDAPTVELNDKFRGHVRVLLGQGEVAIARID